MAAGGLSIDCRSRPFLFLALPKLPRARHSGPLHQTRSYAILERRISSVFGIYSLTPEKAGTLEQLFCDRICCRLFNSKKNGKPEHSPDSPKPDDRLSPLAPWLFLLPVELMQRSECVIPVHSQVLFLMPESRLPTWAAGASGNALACFAKSLSRALPSSSCQDDSLSLGQQTASLKATLESVNRYIAWRAMNIDT